MKQIHILIFLFIGFTLNILGQTQTHNSWQDPVILCAAQDFTWDHLYPTNGFPFEEPESCIKPFESLSSVWFRFRVADQSLISFNIKPLRQDDDIDFAIYSSEDGKPRDLIRCMSSGVNLDKNRSVQLQCSGITGLTQTEKDVIEDPGCGPNHNNFLQSIDALKGEEFLLEITNYRSDNGFTFHWTGSSILDSELCFGESSSEELFRIIANPNPTNDLIRGTIISSKTCAATIRLFNSNGVIIDQQATNLISGINDLSISVKNFSPGTYYLNLIQENLKSETIKIEIVR